MPAKCVLILLDGLGDRSFAELSHQTPLQAADTPTLDLLATQGANGLFHAALLGQALPTENAHFIMFGYDMRDFPGRGILEAAGAGISIGQEDVAVLVHIASVAEENGAAVLRQDTPGAEETEIEAVINAVAAFEHKGISVTFHRTKGLFGILKLSGFVSPCITDSNLMLKGIPLSDIQPLEKHTKNPAAEATAEALREYVRWAYRQLQNHTVNKTRLQQGLPPLNCPVTQRAGRHKDIMPFTLRWGLKGLSISSGLVLDGLCKCIGMDFRRVVDSGNPGKDIADRLHLATDALKDYDFIHVHTKAPDEAAHAGDPVAKMHCIEGLDHGIGTAIEPLINDPETLIVVTADHSTPSSGPLIHSGEPVPLTLCGEGVRRDNIRHFDEVNVAGGALGTVRGRELMYLILNHLNRAKLQGIMNTPLDQPYFPGNYKPFLLK